MHKRIICAVLSLVMMIPMVNINAENEIDSYIDFVSQFNIINGDPDGNYRLNDLVTRAEFTKIAVAASSFRDSIAPNISVSPFKDVSFEHWAAPYIKLAVSKGIVNGYEDATFRPDNIVTYEEGLTMLLKLLGYTNADFGSSWPYAQVGIATNKGLNENVSKNIGDALSRQDCVMLVYNLLNTKKKDSAEKYITEFDSEITEDVILLATSSEDTSVGAGKIATTAGTYKIGFNYDSSDLGKKGDIVVKDGDEITAFIPDNQIVEEHSVTQILGSDIVLDGKVLDIADGTVTYYKSQIKSYSNMSTEAKKGDIFKIYKNENGVIDYTVLVPQTVTTEFDVLDMTEYIVYSVLDDKVLAYNNGIIEQVNFNNSVTVYEEENQKTSYSAIKQNMEMGDILKVKYDSNNDIEYVVYEEGNLKGPITVKNGWHTNYAIDTSNVKVVKDGKKSDFASLNNNDIVYYSGEMGMILAYSRKVVGIYESASPNKDLLTSVTVSGVTYNIESAEAFNKLSSNGEFNFGDTVTLLLGKDGEIADVATADNTNDVICGYLIETGKKVYTDENDDEYTSYYAKIVGADGVVSEYKVDDDYKNYKNSVVFVTYKNSVGKITSQTSDKSVSGVVNYEKMKIGSHDVSDDIEILEVYTTSLGGVLNYKKTYLQRLDGVDISSSAVVYVSRNGKGEINELILKDITGDMFEYGLATTVKTPDEGIASYTFTLDNSTISSSGSKYSSIRKGTPVKILTDLNSPTGIVNVYELLKISGSVVSIDQSSLTTNSGEVYRLSPDVVTFKKASNDYSADFERAPLTEIMGGDYTISAYYDKTEAKGGRIRVILAVLNETN